jgi:hypothetical protein
VTAPRAAHWMLRDLVACGVIYVCAPTQRFIILLRGAWGRALLEW